MCAGHIFAQRRRGHGPVKMDCGALYKDTLVKFHAEKAADLPADKLANAHRIALRAYDACSAGDEFNATKFFQQLAEEAR